MSLVVDLPGAAFEVPTGAAIALLGPPGGAKSGILDAIAAGRQGVLLAGRPPRRRDVGEMAAPPQLFPELTAVENVAVALLGRRLPTDRQRIEQALSDVLLGPAAWDNLVEQLSGGQQQRVAVARALVAAPPLLCLDEPVNELDPASTEAVRRAIRSAQDQGTIAVIATADELLAATCDQVVAV